MLYFETVSAPVNIATLKYWGKRNVELNLPTNSSISVTLSQDNLRAKTTACCGPELGIEPTTEFWLNGKRVDELSPRLIACIEELRRCRADTEGDSSERKSKWGLLIVSENNFPTAAGLASSAAGFAALVQAVANLYQLPYDEKALSRIARVGSGSACRSLFGGFVAWEKGTDPNGLDSQAVQIATADYWSDMRAAILVVSGNVKEVPSTSGMQQTVDSSTLFPYRVNDIVPKRYTEMCQAIETRNFQEFAKLTMIDSNQFHAVCLDSFPPIFYLNDVSKFIINAVHALNNAFGKYVVAYTFDAGPNAVLYYLAQDQDVIFAFLSKLINPYLVASAAVNAAIEGINVPNLENVEKSSNSILPSSFKITPINEKIDSKSAGVKNIIFTKVGDGPRCLNQSESLIDSNGQPLKYTREEL